MMKPNVLFNDIANETSYITSGDDVQYLIKVDDSENTVRLYYQQSKSFKDWINNFDFPVKLYKDQEQPIAVAQGWGDAYRSCNDEVMHSLLKVTSEHQGYSVEICGWSYGGAMAVLAAEDFTYRQRKLYVSGLKKIVTLPDVITFGAPKVLWGKSTLEVFRDSTRMVMQYANSNDCVTGMPPFLGYTHLNKVEVGDRFNLIKWFNPGVYHCSYGDASLYE